MNNINNQKDNNNDSLCLKYSYSYKKIKLCQFIKNNKIDKINTKKDFNKIYTTQCTTNHYLSFLLEQTTNCSAYLCFIYDKETNSFPIKCKNNIVLPFVLTKPNNDISKQFLEKTVYIIIKHLINYSKTNKSNQKMNKIYDSSDHDKIKMLIKDTFLPDKSFNSSVFNFNGYAGTGKTTALSKLTDSIVKDNWNIICIAPTHKAVSVIYKKVINNCNPSVLHNISRKTSSSFFNYRKRYTKYFKQSVIKVDKDLKNNTLDKYFTNISTSKKPKISDKILPFNDRFIWSYPENGNKLCFSNRCNYVLLTKVFETNELKEINYIPKNENNNNFNLNPCICKCLKKKYCLCTAFFKIIKNNFTNIYAPNDITFYNLRHNELYYWDEISMEPSHRKTALSKYISMLNDYLANKSFIVYDESIFDEITSDYNYKESIDLTKYIFTIKNSNNFYVSSKQMDIITTITRKFILIGDSNQLLPIKAVKISSLFGVSENEYDIQLTKVHRCDLNTNMFKLIDFLRENAEKYIEYSNKTLFNYEVQEKIYELYKTEIKNRKTINNRPDDTSFDIIEKINEFNNLYFSNNRKEGELTTIKDTICIPNFKKVICYTHKEKDAFNDYILTYIYKELNKESFLWNSKDDCPTDVRYNWKIGQYFSLGSSIQLYPTFCSYHFDNFTDKTKDSTSICECFPSKKELFKYDTYKIIDKKSVKRVIKITERKIVSCIQYTFLSINDEYEKKDNDSYHKWILYQIKDQKDYNTIFDMNKISTEWMYDKKYIFENVIKELTPYNFSIMLKLVTYTFIDIYKDGEKHLPWMYKFQIEENTKLHYYYNCLIINNNEIQIKTIYGLKKCCNDLIQFLKTKIFELYLIKIKFCTALLPPYCFTVHATQGSTYEKVFFSYRNNVQHMDIIDKTRFLYTGASRASKNLYMIHNDILHHNTKH